MTQTKMKNAVIYNENIKSILEILSENPEGISGQIISEKLRLSRSAISKMVKNLEKLGYKFEVSKKKYKLIEKPDIPFPWEIGEEGKNIIFFKEVDSTQEKAKGLALKGKISPGTWVIAEKQKSGKGRMGRRWESPQGNFYGSVFLKPDLPLKETVKISLIGGLAVWRTIKSYEITKSIKIKWPNDIFVISENSAKKLAGVLAESFGESEKIEFTICGIGVNINNSPLDIAICLKELVGEKYNLLTDFTRRFIGVFKKTYEEFIKGKWLELKTEIEINMWRGKVKVIQGEKEFTGVCVGINPDGSMVLQKQDGGYENIFYGDTTIITSSSESE